MNHLGIAHLKYASGNLPSVPRGNIHKTMVRKQRNNISQEIGRWHSDDLRLKKNELTIINHINNINKHLQFKISVEENNTINYLDLSIHRKNNINLGIYRKPTYTDTTIQFSSNHPYEHKLASFNYYVNRMLTLPITKQSKQQEWKIMLIIGQNNGFPMHIIHSLKEKLIKKTKTLNSNNATEQEMGNFHIP